MMKLSEAMRRGAKLKPQGFYRILDGRKGEEVTCALGAALDGACKLRGQMDDNYGRAERLWPELIEKRRDGVDLEHQITHWNDTYRLTREEIADKLEAMGL